MIRALMVLVLTGCCSFGASEPAAPPTTVAAAMGCLDLCQRLYDCDVAAGIGERAPDCEAGCAPGGLYASVGDAAYRCALEPTCEDARECAGPSLALTLLGALGGSASESTPAEWPAGFPTIAGGSSRTVPSLGPVRMALIAYHGGNFEELVRAYRDALVAGSWTVTDAPGTDAADRFTAARGATSVSVSIYREGDDVVVQTMQIAEAER